ncbi:calcium-binding protein [Metapseudomonas otitidis]|uniref:calcium-binding protein n=1 Tax=Metapseudomonas otitidis TaxID=319939 RepID=UPI001CA3E2D9|nr:calcium-binding protein [Pseudomonas otitidis]QZX85033.1 hypothetical protein K6751_10135 [Pseudomonas otitidis]
MTGYTGQYRDWSYTDGDGIHIFDKKGYSAHIGPDGSIKFIDRHGNELSTDALLSSGEVTIKSGNSSISVNSKREIKLSYEVGPAKIETRSKIQPDGSVTLEEFKATGTILSLGNKLVSVDVNTTLTWTKDKGWEFTKISGEIKVLGATLPEIADGAYKAVESSAVGQLMGTRDEWMEAVINGETTDSHLVWLRKRNTPSVQNDVNQNFNSANSFVQRRDPLSLDLDGDGIETVGTNAGITFDFDGDGLKTGTGWVKGDDGFLVLDRNGNGQIDNGGELFGVDTVKANGQKATDGFDALRDFDSNGDGVFDAKDAQFANVRVWQDTNQDGIAQAGELKTLAEHNIVAINLDSTASNQTSNGNLISATGTFIRGDGTQGSVNANQSVVANLDLASNPFYREFTDPIALDDAAKALPDMKGSGAVRDLREASMLNAELKTLLTTYSQAQTREEQMGLLDKLIAEWAKSANYQTFEKRIDALDEGGTDVRFQYSWEAAGAAPTDAQKSTQQLLERIKALEVFNGQNFLRFGKVGATADSLTLSFGMGTTNGTTTYAIKDGSVVINEDRLGLNAGQAGLLDQAYEALRNSIYEGLLLQTRLKPYVDSIDLKITSEETNLNYSRMYDLFAERATHNLSTTITDALDFSRAWKEKTPADFLKISFIPTLIEQLSQEELQKLCEQLPAFNHLNIQLGNSISDSLTGTSSSDYILGLSGNDAIFGGYGNDLIIGGKGNDTLNGYDGADTYVFNLGDGQDTLAETYYSSSANNTDVDIVRFGEGIAVTGMRMTREGSNLTLHYSANDSITFTNWYASPYGRVEKIEFADGTSRTVNSLEMELGVTGTAGDDKFAPLGNDAVHLKGMAGNDVLNGAAGNDILDGGDDNDTLDGGNGNDTLSGGSGNDAIFGGHGNDLIIGGKGNDTLNGYDGADTYVFNLGDGQDTLAETYYSSSANNTDVDIVRFGEGIAVTGMRMTREGSNLTLHYSANDSITFTNWYASPYGRVEKIEFADGTSRTVNSLEMELGVTGTAGDDKFAPLGNDAVHLKGMAGNDVLNGAAGNDILDGGDDNDTLDGGNGNDTLSGGSGNDAIFGGHGNDLIIGGKGNDTLNGYDGADTYVFNLGDGQDTLAETYYSSSANNTDVDIVRFGEGIAVTGMRMTREGSNLTLHYSANDSITFTNWYASPYGRVEKIEFADGTSRTVNSLEMELGVTGTAGDDKFAPLGNDAVHLKGMAGNDVLNGAAGNDILDGGDDNDTLDGGNGNDTLSGGSGNDAIFGGHGNDLIIGGKGNDTLNGYDGADTYVFNLGDGQDTLAETYYSSSANNTDVDIVRFGEGIAVTGMRMTREGSNLTLHYSANDSITFTNWYASPYGRVEKIEFADGTSRTVNSLEMELGVTGTAGDDKFAPLGNDAVHLKGMAGNDVLNGAAGNDILDGGDDNDTLDGGNGNDTLSGGSGNDAIFGGHGNDLIIGGKGNDTLNGYDGADTYVFNLGDGQDTLAETYYSSSANNTDVDIVRFGEGIAVTGMRMTREGSNLTLHYSANDSITFTNWYASPYGRVEKIEFADGTSRTVNSLEMELGVTGTAGDDKFAPLGNDAVHLKGMAGNDVLNGAAGNDILDGGDDNDTLDGGNGNDTLSGGSGNDAIFGGHGNDLIIGGKGNDTLNGYDGADTYVFNLGDGQDTLAETYYSSSANNTDVDIVRFGEGIAVTGMRMTREGSNLTLHYSANDSITFTNWYASPYGRVEKIEFADGTSRTVNSLEMELGVTGTAGDDKFAPLGNDAVHLKGMAGNDVLNGAAGNDILDGGDDNDTLDGGNGNDTLSGGSGNDAIFGGHGNDLIIGDKGNDTLNGYDGADTYVFNLGDGQDTLAETYYSSSANNTDVDIVRFGEGIAVTGMRMTREGSNLTLHYSANDSITFTNWYASPYGRVEKIEFADGTSRTVNSLEMELGVTGTAGDDKFAPLGNDAVHLKGMAGNDVLNGAAGNDILDGGEGNDTLNGGYGNDTYLFAKGNGQDLITEVGGNDTLLFTQGINSTDLWLQRTGNNLELSVLGSDDKVTVSNWYASASNHVETIKTADGKTLLDSQVQNLVNAMAAFAPPTAGNSNLTPEQRAQLEVVIAANWH